MKLPSIFFSVVLLMACKPRSFNQVQEIPDSLDRKVYTGVSHDSELPNFERDLEKQFGITKSYSQQGEHALIAFFDKSLAEKEEKKKDLNQRLLAAPAGEKKPIEKSLKDLESVTEYVIADFARKKLIAASQEFKAQEYQLAKRMLYTVAAEKFDRKDGREEAVKNWFQKAGVAVKTVVLRGPISFERIFFNNFVFTAPSAESIEGGIKTKDEAKNLFDLGTGQIIESLPNDKESMLKLSVGKNHPAFYPDATDRKTFSRIEKWFEEKVNNDLKKSGSNSFYKLSEAHKVLLYKELKTSATSAKIEAEDLFGEKWKLKWGDEVQVEPVTNRLYARIGAKFTDIVYAGATGEIMLILPKNQNTDCPAPDISAFAACMLNSRYKFDIKPFIFKQGILTEEILLQKMFPDNFDKAKVLGLPYITFKEASAEYNAPKKMVFRSGGTSFSGLGANEDRAARALLLFNMWIGNVDARDGNNRGIILHGFEDNQDTYVEIQHDLGAALGGVFALGEINMLRTGKDFIEIRPALFKGLKKQIFYKHPVLFYPKPWNKATYMDQYWMAERITNITLEEIKSIVSASKWPDFMQHALVFKLVERKNNIAEAFSLPKIQNIDPKFEVDLSSDSQIQLAAKRYQLDYYTLKKEVERINDSYPNWPRKDLLVDNFGRISSCEDTVLQGLIQEEFFPSGLTDRIPRNGDSKERQRGCRYQNSRQDPLFERVLRKITSGL